MFLDSWPYQQMVLSCMLKRKNMSPNLIFSNIRMIFAFSYQTQISKNLQFWWVWDLPSKVMPLATASWLWRSRCIRWVFYILLVVHPVFWIINFIVDSNWHWMPSTAICFTTRAIQFYWTWRLVWTHFIENKLKQIGGTYFFSLHQPRS